MRLPDVIVMAAEPLPKKALIEPPLLAIEIHSESDREVDFQSRARDLETVGIRNIWLIDPEARTTQLWASGAWQSVEGTRISVEGSPVHFDLAWLWKKLGPQS